MKESVLKIISFYQALNRPITLLEIWRLLPTNIRKQNSLSDVLTLCFVSHIPYFSLERRHQDLLLDKKWKKLLKYSRLFSFIPFLNFVFGAGSLALGNVHADSDFDVLIGTKNGRIFTARFFCVIVFGLFNVRRKRLDHKEKAKDKICLNHFVMEKSYCLKPPYNYYWQNLYLNLAPIYGDEKIIAQFYQANIWLNCAPIIADRRWSNQKNFVKIFLEYIFNGSFGNILEKILRYIQLKRIKKNLAMASDTQLNSRLSYTDEELEFHSDTSRIENILNKI